MPRLRSRTTNRENDERFAVRWNEPMERTGPAFTAVLRVRNEARSLRWVLPPLFRSVDRVLLVDNASEDGTAGVARRLARECGYIDRFRVIDYPHEVARCGTEHLETPPDSVHSLTYFYNWSFSHVTSRYALKWDGDMILTNEGQSCLRALAWQLEGSDMILAIPRTPIYLQEDSVGWADLALRNQEPWGWPNQAPYHFEKGLEWEIPLRPRLVKTAPLPRYTCFEIKWLDADEFDHWSSTREFNRSRRTVRKVREHEVHRELGRRGRAADDLNDLVEIRPPPGEHVLDFVTRTSTAYWESRVAETNT